MKEYKHNEELLEHLKNKNVIIDMTFSLIDKTYKANNNSTNLYMLIKSMEKFLSKQDYNDLINLINKEFDKLNESIKSIDTRIILKIMGYPNV